MRFFYTILFVFLFIGKPAYSQDTTKILFVGNSFTAANALADIVRQFYVADGKPVYVYAYAPGGISVGDVAMGSAAHMNNPLVYELIRQTDWDYMVLQDNQGRFSLDSAVFPKVTSSKVIEGHLKIRDSFHHYHPCARMVWFSGWGFKSEDIPMIDRITVNYRVLNDSAKDVIAPIGPAWKHSTILRPMLDLWDADGAHPGITGSFLTAAIIYGTLSQKDVSVNPFMYTLPPTDATFLKVTAWQILTDPDIRRKSNLEGIAPVSLTWDKTDLRGEAGKLLYRWYCNDTLVGISADSIWHPAKSGLYRVWTLSKSGAWQKSCAQWAELPSAVRDQKVTAETLVLFPNPVMDKAMLQGLDEGMYTAEVFSAVGARVLKLSVSRTQPVIDLGSLGNGIYWLRCTDSEERQIGTALPFIKR